MIPPLPHDYPYYQFILDPKSKHDKVKGTYLKDLPKIQLFEVCRKLCMRHTFRSCFIGCINMKWIQQVLLKIQSGHNFIYRQTTEGQTDRGMDDVKPVYPPFWLRWGGVYNNKGGVTSNFGHQEFRLTQILQRIYSTTFPLITTHGFHRNSYYILYKYTY